MCRIDLLPTGRGKELGIDFAIFVPSPPSALRRSCPHWILPVLVGRMVLRRFARRWFQAGTEGQNSCFGGPTQKLHMCRIDLLPTGRGKDLGIDFDIFVPSPPPAPRRPTAWLMFYPMGSLEVGFLGTLLKRAGRLFGGTAPVSGAGPRQPPPDSRTTRPTRPRMINTTFC